MQGGVTEVTWCSPELKKGSNMCSASVPAVWKLLRASSTLPFRNSRICTHRQSQRHTEASDSHTRHTHRDITQTHTVNQRDTHRQSQRETHRESHRHTQTVIQAHTGNHTGTHSQSQRDTQGITETHMKPHRNTQATQQRHTQ